jgi:hypothetical protein
MVQRGDLAAISSYLKHFQEVAAQVESFAVTGNSSLDAILNTKLSAAKTHGIKVDLQISTAGAITVDNFSIATIVGNLLDNAIEASELVMRQKHRAGIEVVVKKRQDNFLFTVSNTAYAPEKHRDTFLSQKEGPSHGLGLIQVRRLVNDNNGIIDFEFTPGVSMDVLGESKDSFAYKKSGVAIPNFLGENSQKPESPGVSTPPNTAPAAPGSSNENAETNSNNPNIHPSHKQLGVFTVKVYLPA